MSYCQSVARILQAVTMLYRTESRRSFFKACPLSCWLQLPRKASFLAAYRFQAVWDWAELTPWQFVVAASDIKTLISQLEQLDDSTSDNVSVNQHCTYFIDTTLNCCHVSSRALTTDHWPLTSVTFINENKNDCPCGAWELELKSLQV